MKGETHAWLWANHHPVRAHFCGPGTNLKERLRRGDKPVNKLDAICLRHDQAYAAATNVDDIRRADEAMVAAMRAENDITRFERIEVGGPIQAKMAAEDLRILRRDAFAGDLAGLGNDEIDLETKKKFIRNYYKDHPFGYKRLSARSYQLTKTIEVQKTMSYRRGRRSRSRKRYGKKRYNRTGGYNRFAPRYVSSSFRWGRGGMRGGVQQAHAGMFGRPEKKFLDSDISDAVVTTGIEFGTGDILTIAAGTGESQRVGRKIVVKSLHFKAVLALNRIADAATGALPDQIRIMVVLDKQCNGAAAAATLLLQTDNITSFRNVENVGRFQMLYDKCIALHVVNSGGTGAVNDTSETNKLWKLNLNVNIPIEYSSTTGAITERCCNNIFICQMSHTGLVAMKIAKCRVRYVG